MDFLDRVSIEVSILNSFMSSMNIKNEQLNTSFIPDKYSHAQEIDKQRKTLYSSIIPRKYSNNTEFEDSINKSFAIFLKMKDDYLINKKNT